MGFDINLTQILSAFVVLFVLIDVSGSIPIFLSFKGEGRDVNPLQAAIYSFIIMTAFLFVGKWILNMFNVDVSSFAVAGALVIFIISIEMIFGVEVFKNDAPGGSKTLVPIVFPLIAGPGTFTVLLSMRAEYDVSNIIIALFLNMIIVFLVLRYLNVVEKLLGIGGVYVLRKFFGVIVMAIAVRLFTANINALLDSLKQIP
ncbi:multiple antibiotic resistance protein [Dysgonomonas sp. PFB1-18]|uniref:MarC family protein n=1 Tax=unclassified Dysgonomonas TaxID=2630389 RepID=UPI0024763CA7|nr:MULTISPECIES: MarC family protein [unclassified Dysgonomonas]MDH6307291.1 multiple antibiotic resistance protein [Dysgonomonas sp. PF1-14]MDH6337209.1 multiple antibiotic resistance protein [Dysgonomonas sp. PF1-16]MDH6379133.1 multiple antibiotic resistance protein [Dysgonomonas sp. PFB1-18]MDH6396229.1 multiple antibiotic resistance protein [Dysgonomonas sp. PF1-23]